jgi:outer membrane protein insertion porin family
LKSPRFSGLRLAVAAALTASLPAFAIDPFVIRDIRVEGVQRTEAGTVFTYMPVKVGERIDDEKAAQAIKALYATGFYQDVRLERDGMSSSSRCRSVPPSRRSRSRARRNSPRTT